jgi:hypothetical protein
VQARNASRLQLRGKIRAGLATKYLLAAEGEPTLSHDVLCGYISCDLTTGGAVLVVDGQPISMSQLERILATHEGWQVELRIVDPSG